jgi:parallel beta-helix repeat protein
MEDVTQSVPIVVTYNDIEFNNTHGISLAHSVFPQIQNNNFRGNGDSSVSSLYLQSGYPNSTGVVNFPELDATCNFWGACTASQATIDVGIHDSLDQSTVHTRVKSRPSLTSNPLTTTPNCSMSCP